MKNKSTYLRRILMTFIVTCAFFQIATAQDVKLNATASSVTIYGTSNVHDWDMKAEMMSGTANFAREADEITNIDKLQFVVAAEGLKSGKGGMDNNTYKALKTDKHKNITYLLSSCTSIKKLSANTYEIKTLGNLTIAGVTKQIPLTFNAKVDGSKVTLTGETKLTMTTYGVDPPKALMGTIKTGDALTIKFKATYN